VPERLDENALLVRLITIIQGMWLDATVWPPDSLVVGIQST
jgi:hypothetical protein